TVERSDDFVAQLLHFHLLTEHILERIVLARLPRADRLVDKAGLSYRQKLDLVDSFHAVDDATIQALRSVNSLRNACSPRRDVTISTAEIEKLGRSFGKRFREIRSRFESELRILVVATFSLIYGSLIGAVLRVEHPDLAREVANTPPN